VSLWSPQGSLKEMCHTKVSIHFSVTSGSGYWRAGGGDGHRVKWALPEIRADEVTRGLVAIATFVDLKGEGPNRVSPMRIPSIRWGSRSDSPGLRSEVKPSQ